MHAAGVDNSSTQLRNPHKIHHKVRHLQYNEFRSAINWLQQGV